MTDIVSKVEEVARAIHDHWQNGGRSWEDCCERLPAAADDFRAKARAAIAAMREPTEAMVKAGIDHAMSDFVSSENGGWPAAIRRRHATMIDAALEEG